MDHKVIRKFARSEVRCSFVCVDVCRVDKRGALIAHIWGNNYPINIPSAHLGRSCMEKQIHSFNLVIQVFFLYLYSTRSVRQPVWMALADEATGSVALELFTVSFLLGGE